MAGFAIGLGNVWRFPYMMGQHGGSAFLFIYLVFVLFLAVPAISAEWALGRATGFGPVGAYRVAFGKKTGPFIGLILLFSLFMALSYYTIVVANIIYSVWFAAWLGFEPVNFDAYQDGLDNNAVQYLIALSVVLASMVIAQRGLQNGIERVTTLFIPIFVLISIVMVVSVLRIDGALLKMQQFLVPDFSRAGPDVWFAAMGQACFSLGISGAFGILYGTYLRKQEKIVSTAVATGLLDTGAALLATLFVVPAVLVFGLNMEAGPGLLFDTLPNLFSIMPGGRFLSIIFMLGWTLVALLSIVCTLDAIIGGLAGLTGERFGRDQWTWVVTISIAVIMFPIAMNPESIGVLDLIFGSGMFMLGGLLAVIALGWGLGKSAIREQLGHHLSPLMATWLSWWLRFVVPLVLFVILAAYLISLIRP